MNTITYAEQEGEKPFDWRAALTNPPEITSLEHRIMYGRSGKWATCACGNQCDVIPRYPDGEPKDADLSALGTDFHIAISRGEWDRARDTLKDIEKRSAELIAAIEEGARNAKS